MAKMEDSVVGATMAIKTEGKPGVKTSEFWGTMAVHFVALMLVGYGMWKGSDGMSQFGAILMGLSQGSYNVGRSMEKKGLAQAAGLILGKEKQA